ncbi:MAG: radical SAM protein [Desulfobacterota bacterium]|jgi:biotin synthase|nr:radical SAM protein [Thermodesulfobacteriota bacterium]
MTTMKNQPGPGPSSPDYLQMSLAAAMTLNLKEGLFFRNARLYCLNLLLTYPGGCMGNCSYCGLQKSRDGAFAEKSFIRVSWPTYDLETIIEKTLENRHKLHRICLSMITHPRALEDTLALIRRFREDVGLPISVLMNPTSMTAADVAALRQAGAQMAAVALDLAGEDLFDRHRGAGARGPHRFAHYWTMLAETAAVFGRNKAGCHLICGLGEREEELVQRIQAVRDLGARTHLFSFYPEKGSRLAQDLPCPAGQYRRVQLARFLIDNDLSHFPNMAFDARGRITDFGLPPEDLARWIDSGRPFMTSGCPGGGLETACNRPFGDGPPSDIRSYPFPLEAGDVARVREQLGNG